ncbi:MULTISPECIES: phosphatase PAP2 family protein [Pseudomonas]|uniref:Phosphatase PAP2 family protein n=1 Tax=Pseudomonas eucalypticola TaxID=2599595 RepID=A0A7D5H4B3_9PSED|nr:MULTISPECIES: phosphatase PAP2 family protein [Pseudomonas]QKZ02564.1 phosphatase PAP2 family protein [Pseudomonas eucalypticola]
MNKPALFQARWNVRGLLLCNLVPLALIGLWLLPSGHALFTSFDEWLFHLLNQPLADHTVWRSIWAVASMRPFDIIVGLILLSLLIRGDWVIEAIHARQATIAFVSMLILLLIIRAVFDKVCDVMGWQHHSPSLVLPDAIKLGDLYPNINPHLELKDGSNQSFPGDHASVLLIWGMFMSIFARRFGQYFVIWGLVLLFSMPRLVAGAHWGQDDYIGGVAMALMALGWGYYTPFAACVSTWLLRVTQPLFKVLQRIPLVRCLSVVSA